MVEWVGRERSEHRDSALFHLDLAQFQRILYATFTLVVDGGYASPICYGCHYFLY